MRTAAILGIAGICAATPAFADPSTGPSWTGVHFGGAVGMGGADITYTQDEIPNVQAERVYQYSDQNAVYSIHLGYDQQVTENIVVGGEIGADLLDFDIDPLNSGGFGNLFSADYDVTATARAGYLTDPNTLIYGRLGLGAISTSGEAGLQGRATALLPAAVFGIGAETLIAKNLSARVEGNYLMPLQELVIPADGERFNPRYMRITAGLSWRLDAGDPADRALAAAKNPEAFNGFYVGATGGYNLSRMDVPIVTPGATVGPYASQGPTFGINTGVDVRLSDFVVGVGAEFAPLSTAFRDPEQNSSQVGATTLFGSLDATAMVTARLGFLASPTTLLYAKGGVGYVQTTANPEFFTFGSGGTRWLPGYQFGGGAETMVAPNVSLRLEGMMTQATEGFVVDLTQFGQASLYPSTITTNAGLNWRF